MSRQKTKIIEEPFLMELIKAIVLSDESRVAKLLAAHPHLACLWLRVDAVRGQQNTHFFDEIQHQLYIGDTPLHAAAAAFNLSIAAALLKIGANVSAKNRRGAEALHYASDSGPMKQTWNAEAQEKMIDFLIAAGANPNAVDKGGVSPLHRAVRTRSSNAVRALLAAGADPRSKNNNGSTALHLAVQNSGKSGSGSPESKVQQEIIIDLLLEFGANPENKDITER
ncbi:MAG: ankyrin repeat domain-containing protein [Candidatus Obscuribacterales bacterium]|nr:ankyrin repeat domain-containing protein [Candidatus Obscuribacterales bacterium]